MKTRIFFLAILFCALCSTAQTSNRTIKVASFNIQNFGKTKLAKKSIVDTLTAIVRAFDVIAVQEISDASNQVAKSFLDSINKGNKYHYRLACSPRTGRQTNDKSSQEQYAFYYNANALVLKDTSLFDDTPNDLFQREPYIASFKTKDGLFSFIICTIHTTPEQAVQEIDALYDVAAWIPSRFTDNQKIIFCGDFNASCSYASSSALGGLRIHQKPFNWIIPDDAKTNLSAKQDCAYDRFIVTDPLFSMVKKWSVYKYFSTKEVSDHWPVYIELKY